jgi:hypothetical protein
MNDLAKKFYVKGGDAQLEEVIFLSENRSLSWEQISEKVFDLPRSWFELSRVSKEERIEFVCDSWLDRLPFNPKAHPFFFQFFSRLDDVAIVIIKKEGEFSSEMLYSLADNSTFFRGFPPAIDQDINTFKTEVGLGLPRDYLAFLKLHNGFGRLSELGLLNMEDVLGARHRVRSMLLFNANKEIRWDQHLIDPEALIPFYEDFGLDSFQCFFSDWYPNNEMGNVYLSGINYAISDVTDRKLWTQQLAFTSFLEWLVYYLEGMNGSDALED